MPQSLALEGLTILDRGLPAGNVVDFVFLHGLNGSPKTHGPTKPAKTMCQMVSSGLASSLSMSPGCRVMTFGYNALFERALVQNTATINDIAQTLISQLIANRRGPEYVDRPLVLIAHSLGGLVIKRALWNIHRDRSSGQTPTPRKIKEQNAIYDSVPGIVFMGTPHSGSHVTNAARVNVLKAIARATFKKVPENLINALAAHSFELQELSQNFENTTIFTQHIIEICTYYETKTQKFLGEERHWSIPFEHEGCHKVITVDVQGTFHGFTFLNDVQLDEHCLDIIALPGLGYDPFRSWQDMAVSDAFMWLRDQLPELVPGAQVALYGYDIDFESQQKNVSIQNIAISLITGLRGIGRSAPSAKPVVFLAHSLGGAVLKQCLIELANTGQSELYMLQKVKTCIFMAVPNCLPNPSELAAIATGQGLEQLLKELQAAKNVRYFESVSGMLRGIALANGIRMCSGLETMDSILPSPKAHREAVALESGNQVIDTIATYIRDSIPSRSVPDVVSNEPPIPEANTWKNALAGILSYLGGAKAEASNTRQKPSTADISRSIESDHDGISSLYERFLSTFKNHGLEREEGISEAYRGTFEWIWTNQKVGFPAWINNDQPLFWIKGKPGSGKSTIMRYIWDHRNLSALIDSGTTERPKIKAAFFFYYRGTHLQKSFEAYKDIITQNAFPVDLFLFVDALDEYDGPHEAIVEFIQVSVQMSQKGSTTLKVCFSSREWKEFEQRFSRGPGFRIHEHTQADIDRYITSRLSNDPIVSDMLNRGSEWKRSDIQDIEDTLARLANGVFIWVRAVIDEIHCLFSRNTPMNDLLEYLNGVPADLEHLYTDSIRRLPHEYRREAYFMFEAMLRSERQLRPVSLQQVVFCAKHQGFDDCVRMIVDNRSFDKACRWTNERGAGLVEIDHLSIVRFIHQTVLDFVARPGFRALMFGNAFELPIENGYSVISKWELALYAVFTKFLQPTSAEEDALQGGPTQTLIFFESSPSTPYSSLALAEQTTPWKVLFMEDEY
ncbi:hypothetical protein V8F33_004334 [Rhypophila sp. PSN 637]